MTTNSAVLTGQLVDAGLGMIPSDPENAVFSPLDYPGLRLWLDVSDADGDGVAGSSYDDANVTQPSDWNPGMLSPALWLDASDLTSADATWSDKGPAGNHATKHGSPTVIENAQNSLSLMRYSGSNGEYHSFANLSNIRTIFWVYKHSGGLTLCLVMIISIIFILVHICLIPAGLLPEFRVGYFTKMVPKFQLPQPISRQVLVYFR